MPYLIIIFCLFLSGAPALAQGAKAGPLHLTLAQSLELAQTKPVGVLVASARVQQAIARLAQARAGLLPQMDASASESRQTRDLRSQGIRIPATPSRIGPFNSFDARVRVTQTIFDPGAFERWRAAKTGQKLSGIEMRKAREDALALVGTMYIQARRARERVQMAAVLLKRDRKALYLARAKYRQGTGSLVELKKARSDYAQSQYLYRQARAEAVQRRLDVGAALQIPPATPVIFEGGGFRAILGDAGRPAGAAAPLDVQAAAGQVEVLQAGVAQAQAGFWPQVAGMADYGRSGESPSNGSNTYTVGVQATFPLWEGGSRQADVALAQARVQEARAVLEDTRRQNEAQTLEARQNIAEAKALINAKTAELAAARQQLAVALKRLKTGTGHELDVDIAAAQKAAVEDDLREASALLWTSKIDLAHALGQMHTLIRGHITY